MRTIFTSALLTLIFTLSVNAELLDVPNVESGKWSGYCSTYGRCSAGIESTYKTVRVGAVKFKPTMTLVYESDIDRFKLEFTAFFLPQGAKYDLRNSYVLLPGGKLKFTSQDHGDAGRGRLSSNMDFKIRRNSNQLKELMSYLAQANSVRINVAYQLNGKRYSGPVDLSLSGSSKVLRTVYAQFDDKGRTFEAGKQIGSNRTSSTSSGNNQYCTLTGLFNWCAFTNNPEATAALVGAGLVAGKVLSQVPMDGGYAPSSSSGNNSAAPSSSNYSGTTTASAPRGVKRIENWGTSPDGSSPQYKITCHNGVTQRYWRQNGEWYFGTSLTSGAAGRRSWDIQRLAKNLCR